MPGNDYQFVTRWRIEVMVDHRWAMAHGEQSLGAELARRCASGES
jgi:hypothetical protein